MVEFLYAGKTTAEELRNAKSNQNIRGKHLVKLVFLLPSKMDRKDPCFTSSLIWLNFCMLERTLTKNQEMKNLTKFPGVTPGQTSLFVTW